MCKRMQNTLSCIGIGWEQGSHAEAAGTEADAVPSVQRGHFPPAWRAEVQVHSHCGPQGHRHGHPRGKEALHAAGLCVCVCVCVYVCVCVCVCFAFLVMGETLAQFSPLSLPFGQKIFAVGADNFPESIWKIFVINTPFIFRVRICLLFFPHS